MGVAGCGKSTIGRKTAMQLDIPFLEGDDFHPPSNVSKMTNGVALTDDDRMPWVDSMVEACLASQSKAENISGHKILACSALSKAVRDRLTFGLKGQCRFIHLQGSRNMIAERLSERRNHFFKTDLLDSQFAALDIPEDAVTLDVSLPIEILVKRICEIIQSENQTQ